MHVNSTFIANIHDIYGEQGKRWLKALPKQLDRLCSKWNLHFIEVMPNLTYNFVGVVELIKTSERAIIKMAPSDEHLAIESYWLQCFSDGVPKIYWFDKEECALFMEQLKPGYSLKEFIKKGDDDTATKIICGEIRNLQTHQKNQYEFTHISTLIQDLMLLEGYIDAKIYSKAKSLFHDLTHDRTQDVILHGDLHHDNILASGSTFKAIDPHGYVGDAAFEVGSMIYNPYDCFPTERSIQQTIERRLKILIDELPFDAKRIKAWTLCKTILSVAWTFTGP